MNESLVQRFCTPPLLPLTDYDGRVLAGAAKLSFPFAEETLAGYGWGEGRTVLLVHGWGSRASHLAHLGRLLSKSGFKAVAFDSPAHYSSEGPARKSMSNMFEYCRAISAVAAGLAPVHAVVGHSFGAICAAFLAAGFKAFAPDRIVLDRLVLISTPPDVMSIVASFCRRHALSAAEGAELKASLEERFAFSVDSYSLASALPGISTETLIIHDRDDGEFPLADIRSLHETFPRIRLLVTEGWGHQKILMNRTMAAQVRDFLSEMP